MNLIRRAAIALARDKIAITDQERDDMLGMGYQMKLQGDLADIQPRPRGEPA